MAQDSLPLQYIKGVGPVKAKRLSRLGITSIAELIDHYPREWIDRRVITPIARLPIGKKSSISGIVESFTIQALNQRLDALCARVRDFSGTIDVVWVRVRSYRYNVFASLEKKLARHPRIFVYGSVSFFYKKRRFSAEDYEILISESDQPESFGRIIPVYDCTAGIDQRFMRSTVARVLDSMPPAHDDPIDSCMLTKRNLLPCAQARKEIHFPASYAARDHARRTLAYREFFLIELALHMQRRRIRSSIKNYSYEIRRNLLTPFKEKLSFSFTASQKKVIREIFNDLCSPRPMHRLLQGDVGSGKTVVALSAMLLAAENGYQSVFMAPTEILADQHYMSLKNFCEGIPVTIGLLKNGMTAQSRRQTLKALADGSLSFCVGTHAMIGRGVRFHNLRLAVIDEQHRFGVMQRAMLSHNTITDSLVMTATPIPRTLAMTLYGDMNISTIDELPPGRKPVITRIASESEAYTTIKQEIVRGHQAYIVYPLIEDSPNVPLKSITSEWNQLKKSVFNKYRVGMLHGKMSAHDKERVMHDFVNHALDVLISTTVIEVGIDVPNATVMMIQHAERYGLATLHQLRGRIGRGRDQSWCILVGDTSHEQAQKRMTIMVKTNDGFAVGKEDLAMRGPGEFLGTAQHGLPELSLGNLMFDQELIQQARDDASQLLSDTAQNTTHARSAREMIQQKFKERLNLARVG
ncbi:MAG: ATP-dependent DNA helicase RecG [Elusimicrobia bacterium]|nr:ATP-dependent DNA helicase RecG [Elusimicrobiota bacterium]MBD3412344.1 ATP-dependent DNA helicase RecG [Elusimicrobiota bacterium]